MRKYIEKQALLVGILMLLNGCALGTPPFMQDLLNNQYFEKKIHADPGAYYIGEWTGAIGPGLTAIKILGDGNIKMCASNEHFGSSNGKIFKEYGKTKMIFESGTQYEIVSLQGDHLIVTSYDQEYKYYSGKLPDRCKPIFSEF
jgi:hypothetical protein